jgi:hypothetical protein
VQRVPARQEPRQGRRVPLLHLAPHVLHGDGDLGRAGCRGPS